MKQRDSLANARGSGGSDAKGQGVAGGGRGEESSEAKRDSMAAAASVAAAGAAQQRSRQLEDKVAALEAKLEQALLERDRCEQDAIMCAAHAQEAAANVEQMAAIVKERARDVDMTKRRITALEERSQVPPRSLAYRTVFRVLTVACPPSSLICRPQKRARCRLRSRWRCSFMPRADERAAQRRQ